MQNLTLLKNKSGRILVVLIAIGAFLIAAFALGGVTFSVEVLKNIVFGALIGAALKLVFLLLLTSKKLKNTKLFKGR